MRPTDWFTPAEFRLALLLFLLAAIGALVRGGESLSPEVAGWIETLEPSMGPDSLTASLHQPWPGTRTTPRPEPSGIDPNTASPDRLTDLPGIGPALAGRMVAARDMEPFHAPEDLLRIRGIGPAILEKIRRYLVFGDSTEVGHPARPDTADRQP